MAEFELIPFIVWSLLTGIILTVSGFSYRSYLRKKKNETPTS